jgi:hypothetical protein
MEKERNVYKPLAIIRFIEPYSLKEFHKIEGILKWAGYSVKHSKFEKRILILER